MFKYIIALTLLASIAHAQEVTIKLNPQELSIVGDALLEQPYKKVAPLLQKIQQQISSQQQPAPTTTENKNDDSKK